MAEWQIRLAELRRERSSRRAALIETSDRYRHAAGQRQHAKAELDRARVTPGMRRADLAALEEAYDRADARFQELRSQYDEESEHVKEMADLVQRCEKFLKEKGVRVPPDRGHVLVGGVPVESTGVPAMAIVPIR